MSGTLFTNHKVSQTQAEDAVRILIAWIGANPHDDALLATPRRVALLLQELFSGYQGNPQDYIGTLMPAEGCQMPVVLRDVPFESICEHHMVPFAGTAHIAYMPRQYLAGLSGIVRVLTHCCRKLHLQERLTRQFADILHNIVQADGVLVELRAKHRCMALQSHTAEHPLVVTRIATGIYQHLSRAECPF